MDPEPGPDLLTGARGLAAALVAASMVACGGGEGPPPPALPAVRTAATVLRLPAAGGGVLAYRADSLLPLGWSSRPVPEVDRPVGFDLDQRILYFLDRQSRLGALDLEVGVSRTLVEGVRLATVGPDGAAFAVDTAGRLTRIMRRTATPFSTRFPRTPDALFGALNGQVIAFTTDSATRFRVLTPEKATEPATVDPGPVIATLWGELLATASGRTVQLVRPGDPGRARRLNTTGATLDGAFSPSGHRLYLLTDDAELAVYERFGGALLETVDLPGAARRLRPDPSGRWMLVQPAGGDSVWVLDLATLSRSVQRFPGAWGATLPMVAGASTLLTAEGADVVARDLATPAPTAVTVVVGGARDTWIAVPWVPAQQAQAALAAAESASVIQDATLLAPVPVTTPQGPVFWLQVSSSQSSAWAADLADQLSASGLATAVWPPGGPDEGYRVVVGPYPSREAAEEAGRGLGRPFFIVTAAPPGRR